MANPEANNPVARRDYVAGITWAVAAFIALLTWRLSHWWLSGDDAYYHIRIAADLREQGKLYFQTLEWTRMSVFHEGWGDKEYLFHLFLVPFAAGNLFMGAKLALSLLNGITAGLLAFFGVRYAGKIGWLAPLAAVAMTASLPVRMEQLRPHNLSLIILLLIANAAASRRKLWLVILGAVYALSYTAWHLPVILCGLLFLGFLVLRKEKRWELLWAPAAGIGFGILVHPGFPDNARIWYLQNFQFFLAKNDLPVGTEIFGRSPVAFALENWRVFALIVLGAAVFWPWSSRQRAGDHEIAFGTFAIATTALYVGAQRFAEYAIPFLALYLIVLAARTRPLHPSFRMRYGMFGAAVALGAAMSLKSAAAVVTFNHERYGFSSVEEMIRFRQAIPEGAKVASTWDFTPFYYFVAPRALYLNVLDPLFMWTRYPQAFSDLEALFAGTKVDVPEVLLTTLGSDYIAYHRQLFPDLATRIERDPRLRIVFQSAGHMIARVDTARSGPRG